MIEVKLPELGENIESAEVSRVLVKEGDQVAAGQNVLELESEKASFPLPSSGAGRVAKIHVKVGDTVSIGQTVLELDEAKADADGKTQKPTADADAKKPARSEEPKRKDAEKAEEPEDKGAKNSEASKDAPKRKDAEKPEEPSAKPKTAVAEPPTKATSAGPATRRLARELGVNLSEVHGSERGGRITRADVKAFVKRQMAAPRARSGEPPLPDFSKFGPVERQPLNKIARTTAARLSVAWRVIPHVTQHDTADVTELEAGRRRFNEAQRDSKVKITMTALAIRAAVAALKQFPRFNSSLDVGTDELIVKNYYHIGIAVDTEAGLLVPVVRDADQKTLVQLAADLTEVAAKARDRSLTPKDMEGATFTITNLGGIGGSFFTPIVNHPEVAILGIGQATKDSAERLRLPLSLSYDHRVINGADGARFIRAITTLLADPFHLLCAS